MTAKQRFPETKDTARSDIGYFDYKQADRDAQNGESQKKMGQVIEFPTPTKAKATPRAKKIIPHPKGYVGQQDPDRDLPVVGPDKFRQGLAAARATLRFTDASNQLRRDHQAHSGDIESSRQALDASTTWPILGQYADDRARAVVAQQQAEAADIENRVQ